jgi:hypothetical protein
MPKKSDGAAIGFDQLVETENGQCCERKIA